MPVDSEFESYLHNVEEESERKINRLHLVAKKLWNKRRFTPIDIQNRCLDVWDHMKHDLGCRILPLVPVVEERPTTNLIFGSGGFSTGKFQVQQYEEVKKYTESPPVLLQGLVTNKSKDHGCKADTIQKEFQTPLIELDFADWYHEFVDSHEENPIRASRYWYPQNDENSPALGEINRRFKLRQNDFHRVLGEKIRENTKLDTDIVSARGYNFQFCRNMFPNQKKAPHVNDTHPADLSYVNPKTKERLYPGWQSGAIQLMMNNNHTHFRGSLIEVEYMDKVSQIHSLDEGALLGLGSGVSQKFQSIPSTPSTLLEKKQNPTERFSAQQIQDLMKIMDDHFFCTLEPTGLILMWGITEKPVGVIFHDINGNEVLMKQRICVVGNQYHGGINAWGAHFSQDVEKLEHFLFE